MHCIALHQLFAGSVVASLERALGLDVPTRSNGTKYSTRPDEPTLHLQRCCCRSSTRILKVFIDKDDHIEAHAGLGW